MTEQDLKAAIDLVLDAYNARKKLNACDDPSVFEPITITPEGLLYSDIDGRCMTQAEFLKVHPRGTFGSSPCIYRQLELEFDYK